MFKIASCNDYLALKRRYRNLYEGSGFEWSLKELGSLFILDHIEKVKPRRILEFGPGFNLFFSNLCNERGIEYWCIDEQGENLGIGTDLERWKKVIAAREGRSQTTVQGLLGKSQALLPEDHFDLVFSISVIEHIDSAHMPAVTAEARRVLRASGVLLNTIDIYYGSRKHLEWHGSCRTSGFDIPSPHQVDWHLSGEYTTFIERQDLRYSIYNSLSHANVWGTDLPYLSQFATALHDARPREKDVERGA